MSPIKHWIFIFYQGYDIIEERIVRTKHEYSNILEYNNKYDIVIKLIYERENNNSNRHVD